MKNWIQSTFLLSALSFFTPTLHAKVGPVVPGQALWCVDQRIGSTADVISSKLAALNFSLFDYFLSSKIDIIIRESEDTVNILSNAISELDALALCPTTNITTPTTIAVSGVYCLKNNIVGPIVVQASDVEINLNNHVVTGNVSIASGQSRIVIQSGVIDNNNAQGTALSAAAGASDITIQNVVTKNALVGIGFNQVSDGLIEGCTLTQNTTGLQLNLSHKIVVEESTADGNRNAGFDLIQSTTCSFTDCKALSTGQGNTSVLNNTVLGFASSQGNGNIFERCIANSTQALSTTDASSIIAGFALRNAEACSKIIECESSNATTSPSGVTVPYGILLQAQFSGLVTVTSINPGDRTSNDRVSSLAWSPDGQYLAMGGNIDPAISNDLYVYQFNRNTQTLQQIISVNPGGGSAFDFVKSVDWSPSGQYLAVAGSFSYPLFTENAFLIYRFDRVAQTLQQIVSINPGGASGMSDSVNAIAWSPNGQYLALGGGINAYTADALYIYKFDQVAQTVQQIASVNPDGGAVNDTVLTVDWSPDGQYLAVGGTINGTTGNDLLVYKFDQGTQTLTQVDSINPDGGAADTVQTVAWSPDGQYLAMGGSISGTTNFDLWIYRFDRNTQRLQQVTSINPGGAVNDAVFSVDWSPDGQYLAIGGGIYGTTGNDLRVYLFDRGAQTLQEIASVNPDGGSSDSVLSVDWSPDGQYLAAGGIISGITGNDLFIFQVLTFPSNNVIKNNTVYCNSGARFPSGVGISGSSIANLIIQNTAYCNPLCQAPGQPIVESNYAFVCNVFNPLFGQAPTSLQNISISCCAPISNPVDLALLMQQSLYKLGLDISGFDVIESRIDLIRTSTISCNAIPITTSPTTITTAGIYCIDSNTISGLITISASDVELNVNNHTITGGISVSSTASRITIMNGVVSRAGDNAILVNSGCQDITVQNITAKNSLVGVRFDSVMSGLIEGCTLTQNTTGVQLNLSHNIAIQQSVAQGNLNGGFDLVQSTTCCLSDCQALSTGQGNTTALNNTVIGFSAISGYGNIFERCIANSTLALSTSDFNSFVAGFALRNAEMCSKIIDCESSNATASPAGLTVPYGILLDSSLSSLVQVDSVDLGTGYYDSVLAMDWSPDGKYLAVGGQISMANDLRIYSFDYVAQRLTQIDSVNVNGGAPDNASVWTVAWSPSGRYLAVGRSDYIQSDDLLIYEFDPITQKLGQIFSRNPDAGSANDRVFAVDWTPDGKYLAVGGIIGDVTGNDLLVYSFDPLQNTFDEIISVNPDGGAGDVVYSVNWSPDGQYLAVGGAINGVTNNDLFIYRFDPVAPTLQQVASALAGGNNVFTVAWSPDGLYLAVGRKDYAESDDLFIYQFDRATNTLQQLVSINPGGSGADDEIRAVRWSADGEYLAVSGTIIATTPAALIVYRFDRSAPALNVVATAAPGSFATLYALSWSPDGQYIATGGFIGATPDFDMVVYRALQFPSNNVIKGNTVYCNSGGSLPFGAGISGSSIANMIIQNVAYENPMRQGINHPIVESNYYFATNVFNALFQQAPTLLQNISVECCSPNCMQQDIGLILKQSYYKLGIAESSLNAISTFIDSPVILHPCDSTPITTSPTTLTGPGIYCIANSSISGLITIDGSDVVLDLNNYTITGGINVTSNRNRITIKNGVVSQTGNNAITVNAGCSEVTIQNVMAKNSLIGMKFDSVTRGLIEGCTLTQNTTGVQLNLSHNIAIQETKADSNRNAGFDLITSTTCCLSDCKAISTGQGNTQTVNQLVVGFRASSGYGNIFERCIANSTQALSTTDFNSIVAGFMFANTERCSKIIECESANATTGSASTAIPCGILLQEKADTITRITKSDPLSIPQSVNWSPDGKYLAVADSGLIDINIYLFDRKSLTLTLIAQANDPYDSSFLMDPRSASWSPDGRYIAVADAGFGNKIVVYDFNATNNTITPVATIAVDDARTSEWSPDGRYIVAGDFGLKKVFVYSFDPISNTLALVAQSNDTLQGPIATEWSPDGTYISVADNGATDDLLIYRFTASPGSLVRVAQANDSGFLTNPRSCNWSPDGVYIVVADLFTSSTVIYKFDKTNNTVTRVAHADDEVNPTDAEWSADGRYISVIVDGGSDDLITYAFDRGTNTLTVVARANDTGFLTSVVAIDWSPDGMYIGLLDNGINDSLVIYQVLTFPSNNVIKNNTVYCDSGSRYPSGIGISGSSIANLIIQNTVYANPINVFMVGTNYAFVQNVFNQLFGQGPSLLQNISLDYRQPVCQPDDLGLILEQILYNVNTLGCVQTVISSQSISNGTISITASGSYCMAEDLTADMLISATCASIDMNNRILHGTITIQNSQDVSVFNGRVQPAAPTTSGQASTAAVTIAATVLRAQLLRLTVICADTTTNSINGRLAIQILGDDALISNCAIKSGAGAANSGGAGGAGGTGILLSAGADRALVEKCLIRTGNGGNGTTQGGNGGDGVVVSDNATQTKIIGCTILQVGAPGSPLGASSPQGGNGVVINSGAIKTLVTQCIIRNSTVGIGTVSAGGLAVDNRAVSTNRSVVYENVVYNIGNDVKYSNFASSMLDEFGVQLDQPPSNNPLNKVANVFFDPLL